MTPSLLCRLLGGKAVSEVQLAVADQYDGLPEDERFAKSKFETAHQMRLLDPQLSTGVHNCRSCLVLLQSANICCNSWASALPQSN
jgi:hypothetical protein